MYSTIQVPKKLKAELDAFKVHPKETYAQVIANLIEFVREDEECKLDLSEEAIKGIAEAEEDLKKGRIFSSRQIKKELGF